MALNLVCESAAARATRWRNKVANLTYVHLSYVVSDKSSMVGIVDPLILTRAQRAIELSPVTLTMRGWGLGHTNLIFCFTSKPTQHFATLILKCKS